MSVVGRRPHLVSVTVPAADGALGRTIAAQTMSAWHMLGLCFALSVSMMLISGAGAMLLRVLTRLLGTAFETLLFSAAAGVVLLGLAVDLGELARNIRVGVRFSVLVIALLGFAGLPTIVTALRQLMQKCLALAGIEKVLAAALLLVLVIQGFASLAPLTGSDALHYHFTVQTQYLQDGFHAPWSLLHGFFCGLSHQLILAGLALGSGQLAQGWLFFGGALGALCTLRLAKLWIGGVWPWLAALSFALTPVAFWQTISAGAPDVWMCAFLPLSLLTILKARERGGAGFVVLAGILAGAVAGTKYTGLIFAGALFAGCLIAIRSAGKYALFFACAVVVGIWPYLRNWLWTGDPVFPFLFARIEHVGAMPNQTALTSILQDTGASHTFSLWELLKFPFFAAVDQSHLGAWQLLGPLVLMFAPFTFPQFRKTGQGRVVLAVWILGALGIGLTSAMSRFLLPLLPVALSAGVAGIALATQNRWRLLRAITLLSLGGFIVAGFVAMLVYSLPALAVVAGRTPAENYLAAHSPDYQRSEFVNREVTRIGQPGRTLVFFRHLYYLRVPFFLGDPGDSWEMNPLVLQSDGAWIRLFGKHQIRWVLKSPEYQADLVESLRRLEKDGVLRVCASGEVESFLGNRIEGIRVREPISLYCVQSVSSAR